MAVAGLHPPIQPPLCWSWPHIRSFPCAARHASSPAGTRRRCITVQIPIAAATLEIPRRQPRRSSHVLKIGSPDRSGGCVAQERRAIREALPKTDGWCGSPGMMRAWMGAAVSGRRWLYQVAAAWIRNGSGMRSRVHLVPDSGLVKPQPLHLERSATQCKAGTRFCKVVCRPRRSAQPSSLVSIDAQDH